MPIVTLRHVVVGAAKADFVKHSIRVSLDLPLTDETLNLRSKLAYLAMEKESITVTLESAQLPLFDDAKTAETVNSLTENFRDEMETLAAGAPTIESITLASGGKEVTLDKNTRKKARFIDQAQLKRERKPRTK